MGERESVRQAAELIRQGRLVAFPTETVYGLGADALNPEAVARIYEAKGRPPTSPLIVHVDSAQMARSLALEWPEAAERLARRYWPGPLTLVLPKRGNVPNIVTAGLATVGLRVPAHPLALALLQEAGVPIAAPSANRFGALSPTTAEHVRQGLGESVDFILDGGPTTVGIESTVLSLAEERPLLLRPGMVSRTDLEAVIGLVDVGLQVKGAHPSPGMHERHYSPMTPLLVVEDGRLPEQGRGAYLWIRNHASAARCVAMPADPVVYAAGLYETLHRIDGERWDWIAVEAPPREVQWAGIADRLRRASSPTRRHAKMPGRE